MKKFLSLAAVASMAVAANASEFSDKNYTGDWGTLKLVGNQLSSQSGQPVQLKGWSTFSLHYQDGISGCLGSGNWQLMKDYGANVVRLAMYVDETNSYLSKPDYWKGLIKDYIAEIAAKNMYVLLDWHILKIDTNGNTTGDPSKYTDKAKDFFSEISSYCKQKNFNNVIYELCNEPLTGSWNTIKNYAEEVIPVILANQPEAICVVGTDNYCQKILEPVSNPITKYKNNVMYSFHYYSCSHFEFLGNFRDAQKSIPVFASEWSAVAYSGDGPMCEGKGDAFIAECKEYKDAPQLVSWCIWNWGHKNEASSTFKNSCEHKNLSKYDASQHNPQVGEYAVKLMGGYVPDIEERETGPYTTLNKIPNTKDNAWMWGYYDLGGEGYAYHDANSSAYEKTKAGEYVEYAVGDENDAFSQAFKLEQLDHMNPWITLSADGTEVADWKPEAEGKNWNGTEIFYKSLNAGKSYSGVSGTTRMDEGVDLSGASMKGTDLLNGGYHNISMSEADEWVNYTVVVEEPGYYKVDAFVSSDHGEGEISFLQNRGNITRSTTDLTDKETYNTVHFAKASECADPTVAADAPWDCWQFREGLDFDEEKNSCIVFTKAGEQELKIYFHKPAGGLGPMVFTKLPQEIVPEESVNTEDVAATAFSIYPNPTSGEFTVALAEAGKAQVEVINVAGQVVYSAEIEGTATINKALAAGVYSVVVKSNGGVDTQKLVVK